MGLNFNPFIIKFAALASSLLLLGGCLDLEVQRPPKVEVAEPGPLRVGTLYGPTTYVVGSAGPMGLDYELAEGFASHLGRELKLVPYSSLSQLFNDMSNDKLDLIASSLPHTTLSRSFWRFSPPLYTTQMQLVYRRGEPKPANLNQINNGIMVMAGSSHAELLAKLSPDYPYLHWQETDTQASHELLALVASGELDYTIADAKTLAAAQRLYPTLASAFNLGEELEVGWALHAKTSNPLFSDLLDYWHGLNQQGRLPQLEEKYFGHAKRFDFVDTRAFIRATKKTLPKYQPWFEEYSGNLDWRKLAAVSYQESHWNPRAKSPTGVRGLMMLTRSTAKRVGVKDRLDPEQSIRGGSQYLQDLIKRLPASIPEPERIWFALAAYNIGLGHVEDARVIAQRHGLDPSSWRDVKSMLPRLNQKRYYQHTRYGFAEGKVAAHYVDNIKRYYDTLVLLENQDSNATVTAAHAQPSF
ncbi:membrane-bound lytic murein transglycosylase MltF [Ferrimonas aestuarii]|uniref:Membrane-bound lytic murein transglycosylase F n=1 Tax=Ferrimonas aestuarii TaxID=2569539 RepID=A0A4U1BNG5_9GAMM|nr:membrane-bound lytic murein transglycosylase MltF [Ferrimonas aestuarii]TKB54683.1 membrane-bound lytic murein transglycosylase MltF [Ferrimonas aestuarii]